MAFAITAQWDFPCHGFCHTIQPLTVQWVLPWIPLWVFPFHGFCHTIQPLRVQWVLPWIPLWVFPFHEFCHTQYNYCCWVWFNRLLVKGSVIIIIIIIFAMCDVCFFFISLISRAVVDGEANTVADKVTNEINRVVVMGPYRVRAGELVDKMTIAIIKERQKGLHPWWRWWWRIWKKKVLSRTF